MPNTIIKKIVCKNCNEISEAKLFMSINATNEPQKREDSLDEKLFKWRCPSCGYEARLTYPVLYNDMQHRFMVYMIPKIDRFQIYDPGLEEKFAQIKGVRKRIVPNFNTFKEKVFIFESGLDDMAVELTKLAISETVAKKHAIKQVSEGYLSMFDRETNAMGFTFFVGERKEPYVQSARLEIYGKSMGIVNELAIKDKKLEGFIKIDREWAANVLFRYKRMKQLQNSEI